jgi:hypothetical protein
MTRDADKHVLLLLLIDGFHFLHFAEDGFAFAAAICHAAPIEADAAIR